MPGARPPHFGRLRWDFGRCRPGYSRSCCSRRGTRRDGWLEVGSGSFQRPRLSARFSPAKLCLRGADNTLCLCHAETARGPRRDPAACGCAQPLCPPRCSAPLRPAVPFSEPKFPGARRSAPRPRSPLKLRCRAALRDWGIFPVEAA